MTDETQRQMTPDKTKEFPLHPENPVDTQKDSITEIKESVTKALECQKVLTKSIEVWKRKRV